MLLFAGLIHAPLPPDLSGCVEQSVLSITTYIIGGKNITYSACVPKDLRVLFICEGVQISRSNMTGAKTFNLNRWARGSPEKLQNCRIYGYAGEKMMTDFNVSTRSVG